MKKTIMPMPVHSIAKTFLSLSNIQAHLMYLGENIEPVDSLKKTGENIYKKHRRIFKQTNKYYYFSCESTKGQ